MIEVNGIELDYDDRTPVSFNVQFMDIRQIGDLSVEGIVSISIRLPRTQRNHLALGHYSSLTERDNTYPYTYSANGNQVLKGKMMVLQRSRNEIVVLLTAKAAEWIEAVKTLQCTDVDLGQRLFNIEEVVSTFGSTGEVAYPFFQFFEDQYQNYPTVNVNNFKPAPNIGNFLRRLFFQLGFNLELVGLMNELDRMHFMRGTQTNADILFEDATTLLDAAAGVGSTASVYLSTLGVNTDFMFPVPFATITQDDGGNLTQDTFQHFNAPPPNGVQVQMNYPIYTSSLGASYKVTLDMRYRIRSWSGLTGSGDGPQGQNPVNLIAKVIEIPFPGAEILVPPAANPTAYNTLAERSFQFTGHIGNLLNPIPVENVVNLPSFVVPEGTSFMVVIYATTVIGVTANAWFEVYRSEIKVETETTPVSNGLRYSLQNAMPEISVPELLRGLVQNFNGMVDTEGGVVRMYCRDEWYLDEADDWTDKTDTEQPIEHVTITEIGKKLRWAYSEDSGDKLQSRFKDDTGRDFGDFEVELSDDILSGETEITGSVGWAASVEKVGFNLVNIPQGVREDDDGTDSNSPIFAGYRMEDRILYNLGTGGMDYTLITFPVTEDPVPVNQYNRLEFAPLAFDRVYDKFWRRTVELINASELVRVWVKLTPADIAELDYRRAKLITLDDGNVVKGWINRITDMRPDSRRSTQVEFIVRNNRATFERPTRRAYNDGYSEGYN